MAQLKVAASGFTVVSSGWQNTGNAFSTDPGDNVYATGLNGTTSKNVNQEGNYTFPNVTSAQIPDGATINSVTIRAEAALSATGNGVLFGLNAYLAGTPIGEITKTSTTEEVVSRSVPGCTLANLRSASTQVLARVRASKGNTAAAYTIYLDYVYLDIDYTAPANLQGAAAVAGAGAVSASGESNHKFGEADIAGAGAISATPLILDFDGQAHFRIRSDDSQALNADAGWAGALDEDVSLPMERKFRIRFEIESTATPINTTLKLQYRRNGGTWTDCPVDTLWPQGDPIVIAPIVMSAQYADGAATTNLLSGSNKSFVAGTGEEGNNQTATVTISNQHTEIEWVVVIAKGYGTASFNADGDTFEYRVVTSAGGVFTDYNAIPLITLDSPYLIGGCSVESQGRLGPFVDTNGNLYWFGEVSEPTGDPVMWKSSDNGVTWVPVDQANNPTTQDYEAADIIQVGDTLYILGQPDEVVWHTFRMSDHGTNPDTWGSKDVSVNGATSTPEQGCWLEVRGDGTQVAFFNSGASSGDIIYKIRSTGGTWGSANTISTANPLYIAGTVMNPDTDLIHLFYLDDTTGTMYHRTLSAADSLSGEDTFQTGFDAGGNEQMPIAPPILYMDGAVEVVMVLYWHTGGNLGLSSKTYRNNVLQTAQLLTNTAVQGDGLNGRRPAAAISNRDTDVWAFYVDDASGDVFRSLNADEGGWATPVEEVDGITAYHLNGRVVTLDGVDYFGYVTDETAQTGGTGPVYFRLYELPSGDKFGEAAIAGTGVVAATGHASHFGSADVSGAGAIAATGERTRLGEAAVSGTGAIAATGERTGLGSADVAGAGTISASGEKRQAAAVAGAGTVSASGVVDRFSSADVAGAGAIEASGVATGAKFGEADVSGAGAVAASGEREALGSADISGSGAVVASGARVALGEAAVSGAGSIAASAQREAVGTADIPGEGTVSASGEKRQGAAVSGAGSVSASGVAHHFGSADISGSGAIVAVAQGTRLGEAAVVGSSEVLATGLRTGVGAAAISGSGVVEGSGIAHRFGAADIAGTGFITVSATGEKVGSADITGSGDVAASGVREVEGEAVVAGVGAVAATGVRVGAGEASISGLGAISAIGQVTHFGSADISGAGAVGSSGVADHFGAAAISGSGMIEGSGYKGDLANLVVVVGPPRSAWSVEPPEGRWAVSVRGRWEAYPPDPDR